MGKKDRAKQNKLRKEMRNNEFRYRSREEKNEQVRPLFEQLNNMHLNPQYPEIRQLYMLINKYLNSNERIEVDIPFPAIGKRIKGVLAIDRNEEVYIMLTKL